MPIDWAQWRLYFERNARRPLPPVSDVDISPEMRRGLITALQKFQLGESGEGRIAQRIDRIFIDGIDDDYRASLKFFVKEEMRHARILGRMIEAAGGERLRRHWTHAGFSRARNVLGVQLGCYRAFTAG